MPSDQPIFQESIRGTTYVAGDSPLTGFSGADIKASVTITPERSKSPGQQALKTFAELQTITITSHRGAGAVRCLGESHVRDYTRGTRTFGGTLVFSVLEKDGSLQGVAKFAYVSGP